MPSALSCPPHLPFNLCTRWLRPMLRSMPLQQAKSEIAGLPDDVTATNAQVMQEELLHHQVGDTAGTAAGTA